MISAIVSALLFGACFPGTRVSVLVFVALTPFFISLSKASNFRDAFFRGATFGALLSVIMAYWVFNALYFHYEVNFFSSLCFLAATVALPMALLLGVFAVMYCYIFRNTLFFAIAVVPSIWTLFDFLRDLLPIFLPWGFAGYSLTAYRSLIQIADIIGVYGVTFFIIAVNSLLARAWLFSESEIPRTIWRRIYIMMVQGRESIIFASLIIILMVTYGAIQIHRIDVRFSTALENDTLTVRVVQGSFALRDRWDTSNAMEILETSLKMTGRLNDGRKYLIVWPETVINAGGTLRDSIIARIINEIGKDNLLVFGGTRQGKSGETYNSAYYVSGKGNIKVYDKIILLPFAETTPWGINILGNFYEAPVRFDQGSLPQVAAMQGVALGFSICFEKIYPWFIRKSLIRGAKLLVNISNDSWFGRSTNPYQSLDIAILRAVENRRFMVVSSNSGISAVITPTGRCAARSGLFTEETIEANVRLVDDVTWYSKFGDVVLFIALIIIAFAVGQFLKMHGDNMVVKKGSNVGGH